MTWPSSDLPFPTPDSDQPPSNPPFDATPNDSDTANARTIDTTSDELNSSLASSIANPHPDPFLGEQIPAASIDSSSADSVPPVRPRTSEVFRAVLPNAGQFSDPALDSREHSGNGNSSGSNALQIFDHATRSKSPLDSAVSGDTPTSGEYDYPRFPWSQLVLLSYASAVTVALAWILWTGRTVHPVAAPEHEQAPAAPVVADEDVTRPADPPLPASNVTTLGKPIRLGDLEITPIAINWKSVHLVRSIEPFEVRKQDSKSLMLHLSFKNLAQNSFAPFDREFVREQSSHLDESYIELPDRKRIGLFALALDSEWAIRGQDFSPIDPGQSLSTILVSAPIALSRLAENQTWRLRVRTDTYKTDILGIQFSSRDVGTKPPPTD